MPDPIQGPPTQIIVANPDPTISTHPPINLIVKPVANPITSVPQTHSSPLATPPIRTVITQAAGTGQPALPLPLANAGAKPVVITGIPQLIIEKQNNAGPEIAPGAIATSQMTLQSPTIVLSGTSSLIIEKQNNPGAVIAPAAVTTTFLNQQSPALLAQPEKLASSPLRISDQTTLVQGNTEPVLQRLPCPPGNKDASTGMGGDAPCFKAQTAEREYTAWADLRLQTTKNTHSSLGIVSDHRIQAVGIDRQSGRFGYGLAFETEKESGSVLFKSINFETNKNTISPFARFYLDQTFGIFASLSYGREKTTVDAGPIKGEYQADHTAAALGAIGYFPVANGWIMPTMMVSKNAVKTGIGRITANLGNSSLNIVTDPTTERSTTLTGAVEVGNRFFLNDSTVLSPHLHLALHQSQSKQSEQTSGDLRIGMRLILKSASTIDFSFARLGYIQDGESTKELRMLVTQSY